MAKAQAIKVPQIEAFLPEGHKQGVFTGQVGKAKAKAVKEELQPTTTVKGKVVRVVGTKGGAISAAQQQAKASRLKGTPAPEAVAGYKASQQIKMLDSEEVLPPRPGTYRHKAFEAMAKCKTVGEYALTGHKTKYLNRWSKQGLIRIV